MTNQSARTGRRCGRRAPRWRLMTALLVLTVIAAGCGSDGSDGGETGGGAADTTERTDRKDRARFDSIEVGVIPIIDVAPIYLGEKKGFFSDRGIDLKLSSGQGGAAIVPGVVSGQMQFGFSNISSLLSAHVKGLPIKAVAAGLYAIGAGERERDYGGLVAVGDSGVQGPGDLVGRTVGVNALSGIAEVVVRESVRKAGADPDAVKFVEIPFPDMPGALTSKRVDAAWVLEPFLTIVQNQGHRVIAWSFEDVADNLMISAYFTSTELRKSNPDLVERFTDAINESLEYAASHEDEVRDIIQTYTKIPPEVAAKVTLPRWTAEVELESVEALAEASVRYGFISGKPDIAALMP